MEKFIKLVRSRVVTDSDKVLYSRITDRDEYIRALRDKIDEESREYKHDPSVEELADILEVLMTLATDDLGVAWSAVEDAATLKRNQKGVFNGRMALYIEGKDR